jgi:xylose isomerase
VADAILADGQLDQFVAERYAGWQKEPYAKMLSGKMSLEEISAFVLDQKLDPKPRSGRQEMLENLVARFAP